MKVFDASGAGPASAEDLLDRYTACLAAADFRAMAALWDRTAARPFCVVDELHNPITSWEELEVHHERLLNRIVEAEATIEESEAWELAPGLAAAYGIITWSYVEVSERESSRGQSRLSALVRETAAGWLLLAAVEGPIHLGRDEEE